MSFPQNMYILNHIQDKKNQRKEKQICEDHGKELVLYCMDDKCQKAICMSCLSLNHKKHEVIDIEEQEKEILLKDVREIKQNLELQEERISQVKEDVDSEADRCIESLKKTKEDFVKHFDEMIEKAESQRKETNLKVDQKISAIRNKIQRLVSVEDNLKNANEVKEETIESSQEIVEGIIINNIVRSFNFPVFTMGPPAKKMNLGNLSAGKVFFQEHRDDQSEKLPYRVISMSRFSIRILVSVSSACARTAIYLGQVT